MDASFGCDPRDERLHLRQSALGLGMHHVIGEIDRGRDRHRNDQASGVEIVLRERAFRQRDSASANGRLNDEARLVEPRSTLAVDAANASRGQPHRPVRAAFVGVGRSVMQEHVPGEIGRRADRI